MASQKILPLWLLALGTGSAVMGITLITPALPVISRDLQIDPNRVQYLLTAYLAMLAGGQLFYGPLSDVFGRRIFFRMGALFITLGGLFALMVTDITLLTLCRVLQGLGAGACISMGRTMVNDYFAKEDAAKAMATVQTIQAIVPMLALVFGGTIVFLFGWQGVMGLIFIAGFILLLGSFVFLPETNPSTGQSLQLATVINGYQQVLTNPVFVSFMIVSSLQVGAFFTMNAFIPYAYEAIGVNSLAFGFYFAMTPVGYVAGNLFNRLYMVKKGVAIATFTGCILAVTSLTALVFVQLSGATEPLAFALPCAAFGFGNGLTVANATIGGISAARANAGTASGLIGAVTMVLGGVGGAVVIALGAADNVQIGFVGILAMACISLACIIHILRKERKAKKAA